MDVFIEALRIFRGLPVQADSARRRLPYRVSAPRARNGPGCDRPAFWKAGS
jgi:hypothetical protein